MGRLTILAIAIAIAATVGAMPRGASAERYYPWCAWYDAYSYSCGFVTRAQCMATVSGAGGVCKPNVYGPAFSDEPRRRY
jgi:Protein of unknown function (DUF3551)